LGGGQTATLLIGQSVPAVDASEMTPRPIHFTTDPQAVIVTTNKAAAADF
jgi:hypothetical protein